MLKLNSQATVSGILGNLFQKAKMAINEESTVIIGKLTEVLGQFGNLRAMWKLYIQANVSGIFRLRGPSSESRR